MAEFKLYDNKGNHVGDIQESGDPLEGTGCVFVAIITFIIVGLSLMIWPGVCEIMLSDSYSLRDKFEAGISAGSVIADIVVHSCRLRKKRRISFASAWFRLIGSATFIPGIICGLICQRDDVFSLGAIFTSMGACLFLAVGPAIIGAIAAKDN